MGMVQKQVTPQGWLGSTPEGRRPQVRGLRAGGSLAVGSSTPATQVLSPPKMLNLNHAGKRRVETVVTVSRLGRLPAARSARHAGCRGSVVRALNPLHWRRLQPIAAYCSFWRGFPCRLAARDAIDNEFSSWPTEPRSLPATCGALCRRGRAIRGAPWRMNLNRVIRSAFPMSHKRSLAPAPRHERLVALPRRRRGEPAMDCART